MIQFSLEEEEAFLEVVPAQGETLQRIMGTVSFGQGDSCDPSLQADSLLFALPCPCYR